MIKLIGMGLVLGGCSAAGFAAERELSRRVRDIRELMEFLRLLEGEIRYGGASLPECFRHIAGKLRQPYGSFLQQAAGHMEEYTGDTLGEILARHMDKELSGTALSPSDRESFLRFADGLGYLDAKMQLAAIAFYREQLERDHAAALELCRSQSKLYRFLGVMGGLFLVILLA